MRFAINMLLKAIMVFGYLSAVNAETMLPPLSKFYFRDVYYIRPPDPNSGRNSNLNWTEAQQRCKDFNATLPIFENLEHHESFEAAIRNLTTQDERMGLWLGAKASSSQWSWLNGSIYHGTDWQPSQGEYKNSYAYVSKISSGKVLPFASSPTISYSYICSYPILPGSTACKNGKDQTAFYIGSLCYTKYDTALSWFSARNACLANSGDLASFSNISLLEGYIASNPVWIGLRKSTWVWQNAVTCLSPDVTFTLWKTGQPDGQDDATPNCISTDSYDNFTGWRDWNCTNLLPFICQVNITWVQKTTAACTTPPTPSGNTRVSSSTIENNSGTTYSTSPKENQQKGDTGSVNIALAVGLGVGIGVPVIILITIIIIVVIVRRKRRSSIASGNSQSRKTFVTENSPKNPKNDQMELNETENGGTRMDNSAAQYATITEATGPKFNPPSTQGTVYEDLGFDQAGSS